MPVAEHVNTTGTVAFSDNTLQHRAQCDQFDHTGVETAYDVSARSGPNVYQLFAGSRVSAIRLL